MWGQEEQDVLIGNYTQESCIWQFMEEHILFLLPDYQSSCDWVSLS